MTIITIDTLINAAYEQAAKFNHSQQTTQQAVKQAILLALTSNSIENIYVRDLSPSAVVYAIEKVDDNFVPAKLMRLPNNHSVCITDGVRFGNFLTKEIKQVGNLFVGLAKTSKQTCEDAHDGRHATLLKLDEYAVGGSTNYIMFNDYLIINLMWNEDQREFLLNTLLSEDTDSTKLVVNHKNNDTRDISADNLEFCKQSLNIRHGQFIQMLAASKNYSWLCGTPYYVAKSKTSDKGKWVTPLKTGISAYDIVDAFDKSVDYLVEKYDIKKEEE